MVTKLKSRFKLIDLDLLYSIQIQYYYKNPQRQAFNYEKNTQIHNIYSGLFSCLYSRLIKRKLIYRPKFTENALFLLI